MSKTKLDNKKEKVGIETSFRDKMPYYVMLAPFMVFFAALIALPMIASVALSFFEFDMVSMPVFNGFSNYFRMLFDDEVFITTLKNTLILAVITGPAGFLLSFVLAWFLNEFKPTVRTVLSFMFYCPALIGNAYYIWQVAFSNDSYGYVNSMLLSLGFITEPVQWLKNASYVMPIIIAVQLWMSMGVSFLANISGLQNVNSEMYEAGAIDGIRNRWQELWYITLPSMQHMLLFSAVMQIVTSFSVSTVSQQLCGLPSTNYSAHTIVLHITDYGNIRYEMGYACAISVVLFIIMLLTRKLIDFLLSYISDT